MNNSTNVAFAVLILDNKMEMKDVPASIQNDVLEVVNYFTKKDGATTTATKPVAEKQTTTTPAATAAAVANQPETKTVTINPTKEA